MAAFRVEYRVPPYSRRSADADVKPDAQANQPVVFESLGEAGDYTEEELRALIAAEFVANEISPPAEKWPLRKVLGLLLAAGIILWALIFLAIRYFF